MFFWQTSNCSRACCRSRVSSLRSSARHFAEDLPGAGVFDAAGRLGRRLAEHLADLQAAVGPRDHAHSPAALPAGGGRKNAQKPHRAVANHVVSHDRMSPIPFTVYRRPPASEKGGFWRVEEAISGEVSGSASKRATIERDWRALYDTVFATACVRRSSGELTTSASTIRRPPRETAHFESLRFFDRWLCHVGHHQHEHAEGQQHASPAEVHVDAEGMHLIDRAGRIPARRPRGWPRGWKTSGRWEFGCQAWSLSGARASRPLSKSGRDARRSD